MERQPQESKATAKGAVSDSKADTPAGNAGEPAVDQSKLLAALHKTMRRFFPHMRFWLKGLPDFRDPLRIIYPIGFLIWLGICLFLFRLGARRRLRFDLNSQAGLGNLNCLAGTNLETIAHPDTLKYLLKFLPVSALEWVRLKMVKQLLRSRALDRFRLLGTYWKVAFDGTGHLVFKKRHCRSCLTQTHPSGKTVYYHPVLEAKLVCENGLAISMTTEFIENTDGQTKQDCEVNAFYRLLPKLRKDFPMLPICLLLDANFLNQNVMQMCEDLRLKYITTFKEGSLPNAYSEFETLQPLCPGQSLKVEIDGVRRRYRWFNGLEHEGHKLNALECLETTARGKTKRFVWATNIQVSAANVVEVADMGGRLRWKIENEGFNTQKNGGYNLEHAYIENMQAAKNLYILLQIAHMISQLIERGNLLGGSVEKLFGGSRAFAQRLLEAFRNFLLDATAVSQILSKPFQIRFDTS